MKIFVVSILLFFDSYFIFAQESSTNANLRNDLKGIGLLFFGGDRILPDITGGGLAGRYWLQNNQALGFGVIIDIRSFDTQSASLNAQGSLIEDFQGFNLFGRYEWHFPINQNISPFIAPGFAIGYIYSEEDNRRVEEKTNINHFAGTLGFGIEYFFTDYFSLSLSSAFVARYSITSKTLAAPNSVSPPTSSSTKKDWFFGTNTVALSITFYFR